jgi:hypothetical protein
VVLVQRRALSQLLEICQDIHDFLSADDRNVAAIHCKAGKGRTGTVIAAYLVYCNEFDTSADALTYFGVCRTVNGKGVTIPSQIRYVEYFTQVVKGGGAVPEPAIVVLNKIRMHTTPDFDPTGGCDPCQSIQLLHQGNPLPCCSDALKLAVIGVSLKHSVGGCPVPAIMCTVVPSPISPLGVGAGTSRC